MAYVQEIVNQAIVKGYNCAKIRHFYGTLSKNYHDALLTLREANILKGFVIATLNKLLQVKPDLVRTDNSWENWDMAALIE